MILKQLRFEGQNRSTLPSFSIPNLDLVYVSQLNSEFSTNDDFVLLFKNDNVAPPKINQTFATLFLLFLLLRILISSKKIKLI